MPTWSLESMHIHKLHSSALLSWHQVTDLAIEEYLVSLGLLLPFAPGHYPFAL